MKLSDRTIQILTNFQKINPSIVLQPGTFVTTKSPEGAGGSDGGNIIARADIEEEWPVEFGIYDLARFINTLTLMGGSITELEFHENYVLMSNENLSFKYHRSPTNLIATPGTKRVKLHGDIKFKVTESVLKKMDRLSAVNEFPEIAIIGSTGTISLQASSGDKDNSLLLNDLATYEGPEFKEYLKWSHLKMLPLDYDVEVKEDRFVRFTSVGELGEIDYVVAVLTKR